MFGGNVIESQQPAFGKAPKTLNSVDVGSFLVGITFFFVNAKMFIPVENQPIASMPLVCKNGAAWLDQPFDDGTNLLTAGVFDDLSVNVSIAFEDTKQQGFWLYHDPACLCFCRQSSFRPVRFVQQIHVVGQVVPGM